MARTNAFPGLKNENLVATYGTLSLATSNGAPMAVLTSNSATTASFLRIFNIKGLPGQKVTVGYDYMERVAYTTDPVPPVNTLLLTQLDDTATNRTVQVQRPATPKATVAWGRRVFKFTIPTDKDTNTVMVDLEGRVRAVGAQLWIRNVWVDVGDEWTDGSSPERDPFEGVDPALDFSSGKTNLSIARFAASSVTPGNDSPEATRYTANAVGSNYAYTPRICVVPGEVVTVGVDFRAEDVAPNPNTGRVISLYVHDAAGNAIARTDAPSHSVTGNPEIGNWKRYSYSVTVPAGGVNFYATFNNRNMNVGDYFELDNLQIDIGPVATDGSFRGVNTYRSNAVVNNPEKTGELKFSIKPATTKVIAPKVVTTNELGTFTLEWNIEVLPDSSLEVDCKDKSATVNGVSYPPIVRQWPRFATGTNRFSFRAGAASSGARLDITYHPGS